MFTAMVSRFHLLVAFLGLTLALGVGWAAFEFGRGHFTDAPRSVAEAPTPEQAAGDDARPEEPTATAPAAPREVASGAEPGADTPQSAPTVLPEQPQVAPISPPQLEEPALARAPEPAARDRAAPQSAPPPREAVSAAREATTVAPPAAAPQALPAVPPPQPAVAGEVAPPTSEDHTVAAPSAGASLAERDTRGSAPEVPAISDTAGEARRQPPAAAAEAVAQPPAPAEPAASGETGAVAEPAPADGQSGTAPSAAAVPPPATAQAAPDEPAGAQESRADQPASARARAAESIRRALTSLFGGAADEPAAAKGGEAEVAAIPDTPAPAPDPGSAPADLEPGAAPSFDIVRIEPGGHAVMAGRAAPGAEVEIRSGDRLIDRVRADRRGEWVAVPPEPLAGGVQELRLSARLQDRPAVDSEEVVVVAIPSPPPPEPALQVPHEALQVVAGAPADEAFAVALPRAGGGKGRILQAPGRISSGGALALLMLDYDDAGRIRLSGEAAAGSAVRIYVDNQPAGASVVGPSGRWDAVLERTLTPGDYTLRLDQVDASGRPDARLETPFTRVSHPPVEGDVAVDYVIVQPGNSLWRIARRVYGEGMRYVHIYEANETQIRDPDLIYPGQVFEIPSGIDAAG
jgi:nucleoid-associated protein YgaU